MLRLLRTPDLIQGPVQNDTTNCTFKPLTIRSGEHGDIGGRRSMEDASFCLDDVVVDGCPDSPFSLYGVSKLPVPYDVVVWRIKSGRF